MRPAELLALPRLRSRSLPQALFVPLHSAMAALVLVIAFSEGAQVQWIKLGVLAAGWLAMIAAARRFNRNWFLFSPLVGAAVPFLVTPASALAWNLYAVVGATSVVLVRPNVLFALFLAAAPWSVWACDGIIFGGDALNVGPMALTSLVAAAIYLGLGSALGLQAPDERAAGNSNAWLLRMQEREPIDAELREWLGAAIMGVAAECRLGVAGDDAALYDHLAAADGLARRGLERLRVTSRALRNEAVECDVVAGFLRNAVRGLAGERIEFAMHADVATHLLSAEQAYGIASLSFDMLEAVHAYAGGAVLSIYCDAAGYSMQLRRPLPEFAYAQTREWTALRKRADRMRAECTTQSEGGRLTLAVKGHWPSGL